MPNPPSRNRSNEVRRKEKMNHGEYRSCLEEADKRMKAKNGHTYMKILKTRCIYCNASPKVKTKCRRWFDTFVECLGHVMTERGFMENKS